MPVAHDRAGLVQMAGHANPAVAAMASDKLGDRLRHEDPAQAAPHFEKAGQSYERMGSEFHPEASRAYTAAGAAQAKTVRENDFIGANNAVANFAKAEGLSPGKSDSPLGQALHFAKQGGPAQDATVTMLIKAPIILGGPNSFQEETKANAATLSKDPASTPATKAIATLTTSLLVAGETASGKAARQQLTRMDPGDFNPKDFKSATSQTFNKTFDPAGRTVATPKNDLFRLKKVLVDIAATSGDKSKTSQIASDNAVVSLAMGSALQGKDQQHAIACYTEALNTVDAKTAPDVHVAALYRRSQERAGLDQLNANGGMTKAEIAAVPAHVMALSPKADLESAKSHVLECEKQGIELDPSLKGKVFFRLGNAQRDAATAPAEIKEAKANLEQAGKTFPAYAGAVANRLAECDQKLATLAGKAD